MTSTPLATTTPGEGRRLTAVSLDAVLAVAVGLAAAVVTGVRTGEGPSAVPLTPRAGAVALAASLAVSFANHVLLTWATRASLGKLAAGLRVVRAADGGRAGPARLVGRWLWGFGWAVVAVPLHVATDSDVEQQDAMGLRVVRGRPVSEVREVWSVRP
ncbi:RDD family protein [Streptomyces sp. NPDC014006]|uniref:RDD family protein n=1 Tax=Streptomyces sp. NPDC014006 TaxID=3364870 RepID=UPI00370204D0